MWKIFDEMWGFGMWGICFMDEMERRGKGKNVKGKEKFWWKEYFSICKIRFLFFPLKSQKGSYCLQEKKSFIFIVKLSISVHSVGL